MTQPQVTITELDGALGVQPVSAGRLTAFIGTASAGPLNQPVTFGRVTDAKNTFQSGTLLEAAGYYITNTGRAALMIRADGAVAGSVGPVTHTGTGTAILTVSPTANTPPDDLQFILRATTDGTVGTAGIYFEASADGGYSWGAPQPLGTATEIVTPYGVTFAVGTGTVVKGDTYSATGVAPNYDGGTLAAALDALGRSAVAWEQVVLVGPLVPTLFDNVELWISGLRARGRYRSWLGTVRMPDAGETEAAYLASLSSAFTDSVTTYGALTAGATRLTSGVSGQNFRRPLLYSFAGRQGSVSEEINVADVNLGPLPGARITDRNGNPIEHDESLYPGLDDARFVTARSWDGYGGVYINRPRLMSQPTSDFQIVPYRRVLNLAEAALRDYFIRRLNRPVRVDTTTGFILDMDALEIEAGATEAMRAALLAKPKASAVQFVLSRIDNVLATKTLTGTARVIPLAYPEFIEITIGFYNPALAVAA